MAYATVEDVQARMTRTMSESEQAICSTMLDDAAVIIDSFAAYWSNTRLHVRSWLCPIMDSFRRFNRGDVLVKA